MAALRLTPGQSDRLKSFTDYGLLNAFFVYDWLKELILKQLATCHKFQISYDKSIVDGAVQCKYLLLIPVYKLYYILYMHNSNKIIYEYYNTW